MTADGHFDFFGSKHPTLFCIKTVMNLFVHRTATPLF